MTEEVGSRSKRRRSPSNSWSLSRFPSAGAQERLETHGTMGPARQRSRAGEDPQRGSPAFNKGRWIQLDVDVAFALEDMCAAMVHFARMSTQSEPQGLYVVRKDSVLKSPTPTKLLDLHGFPEDVEANDMSDTQNQISELFV